MNIHNIYRVFQLYFRPMRIRALKAALQILNNQRSTILDVGGTAAWWSDVSPATRNITIVNMDEALATSSVAAGYNFLVADGRKLPFADKSFDLVHSNSVIEHVGSIEDQRLFASEMRRCGRVIYLQTPNRWFPVEPHLIALFIHWLPFSIERRLVRWFSIWGLVQRPSQQQVDNFLSGTRLLNRREMALLFPGDVRRDEKFLGLTKSFVVIRTAPG